MSDITGHRPFVCTVSPGRPFLEALATAILAGDLPRPGSIKPDAADLSAWTILLPTRRAARTLQEAFLKVTGGHATLLPGIRPIAEGQEELELIESAASLPGLAPDELTVPPAIGTLERSLLLTELALAWSRKVRSEPPGSDPDQASMRPVPGAGASTPAQAARLARELARLIDAVETENVAMGKLAGLVPEDYSAHWQQTLKFLEIVTDFWPAHLTELGMASPADRRNRLILGEARRIAAEPPKAPIIVAGVTGSIPATSELMRAVAGLPNGAIVLPGLDPHLDAESFGRLATGHPEHPQHGLARLIAQLGLDRSQIAELPGPRLTAQRLARNRLVSEAMRPTGTMDGWRRLMAGTGAAEFAEALTNVDLIEAPTAEDEAEVVALILREALETPGRTAALVSPDRLLARRVAARLEAWGIRVDDSAGRPFAKTVPGSFLELVANAYCSGFAPADLMALLKHPLTRLSLSAGDVRRRARNLEVAVLRTTYLGRGLQSLSDAIGRHRTETKAGQRRHRAVTRLGGGDWNDLHDLVQRLEAGFATLAAIDATGRPSVIADIVRAHVAAAEAVAQPAEAIDLDSSPLWDRDEGTAAALVLARFMNTETPQPKIGMADYPELFRALVGGESIRVRVPRHPRLSILGPYEARLQQPDVIVLGSLNEGVWPKASDSGPWLNRGMRAELGLPDPEEEIGRAAHDIAMLLGAETVHLTRANKVSGVPMTASRWLLRLQALLAGLGLGTALTPSQPWLAWARARDHAEPLPAIKPPEPRPPLALRPRRGSVSDIETWLANPYAIYARRILLLEALPPLGREPGPSERGQIVHEALARFTKAHPDRLPQDVVAAFMACADEVIGDLGREPRVRAFWRPRLARFAQWLAETETGRRAEGSRRVVEVAGNLVLDAPAGPFVLTARADRIDIEPGGLVITDYKTGGLPTDTRVLSGEAPQLPLEAAMAEAGAFAEVKGGTVAALRYIRATGGEPPGEERLIRPAVIPIGEVGARAQRDLSRLIADFDHESTPYRALRRRRFQAVHDYDDYAHLARFGEWAAGSATGDGGDP